jgi:hypothetical protein
MFGAVFLVMGTADAAETYKLEIKDHRLVPAELTVPKGEAFYLEVANIGPGSEEIESHGLKIEKIILEGQTIRLRIGPQKPGTFAIFGEFHADSCKGTIVVK